MTVRDADWMGLTGFNLRSPRRVRPEIGERACLTCLAHRHVPTAADHAGHPRHEPPDELGRLWRTGTATRWDAIPVGTLLRLVARREWRYLDHIGPNSSVEAEWLLVAVDSEAAGASFRFHGSTPDDSVDDDPQIPWPLEAVP
jgi:hypothetical protein